MALVPGPDPAMDLARGPGPAMADPTVYLRAMAVVHRWAANRPKNQPLWEPGADRCEADPGGGDSAGDEEDAGDGNGAGGGADAGTPAYFDPTFGLSALGYLSNKAINAAGNALVAPFFSLAGESVCRGADCITPALCPIRAHGCRGKWSLPRWSRVIPSVLFDHTRTRV